MDAVTDRIAHRVETCRPARVRHPLVAVIGLVALVVPACGATASVVRGGTRIYQGHKTVLVEATSPAGADQPEDTQRPMLEAFLAAQVEVLGSRPLAEQTLQTPSWTAAGGGVGPAALARFEAGRRIVHEPGTARIEILFRDRSPTLAVAGAQALAAVYEEAIAQGGPVDDGVQSRIDELSETVDRVTEEILDLTKDFGGVEALAVRHLAAIEQLLAAEAELARLRERIRQMEAVGDRPEAETALTAAEIAVEDPTMARLLLELETLRQEGKALPDSDVGLDDVLEELRLRIERKKAQIEQFTEAWNQRRRREIEEPKEAAKTLEQHVAKLRAQVAELGAIRARLEELQDERDRAMASLKALKLRTGTSGFRIRVR